MAAGAPPGGARRPHRSPPRPARPVVPGPRGPGPRRRLRGIAEDVQLIAGHRLTVQPGAVQRPIRADLDVGLDPVATEVLPVGRQPADVADAPEVAVVPPRGVAGLEVL